MNYYARKIAPDGRPFISNSFLGGLKAGLDEPMADNPYFLFGRVFHTLCLEPDKKPEMVDADSMLKIVKMRNAFWQDVGYDGIFMGKQIEHEIYRKINGFWHKSKLDIYDKKARIVTDLKSTSATTDEQFAESCRKYEYDRQGYFYLEIAKADQFILKGVSKINYKVFTFVINRDDLQFQLGKLAYYEGLKLYKQKFAV